MTATEPNPDPLPDGGTKALDLGELLRVAEAADLIDLRRLNNFLGQLSPKVVIALLSLLAAAEAERDSRTEMVQEFERARDSALAEWQREKAAKLVAEARLSDALKALEPFGDAAKRYEVDLFFASREASAVLPDDYPVPLPGYEEPADAVHVTWGDFRRAHEITQGDR